MLLPLYLHPHSFSSKTLDPVPLFFPSLSIKTLYFQNPKPSKFIIRSSTADPETVSKSAIQRISEKLRNLGYLEENSKENEVPETGQGSPGEIFIPFSHELPKHRVGYTIDSSWSTPENPVPAPGSGAAIRRFHELKIEVEKQKKSARKEERAPSLAELAIPEQELKRLREIGIELKKRLKVGKAGVTEGIVNGIHERWRRSELVKIKCEDLCRMNMKRTHDILERKTGGLVIWRSGSIIILYRGANYEYPYFLADTNTTNDTFHDVVSFESSRNCEVDGREATNSSCTVSLDSAGLGPSNRTNRSSLVHGVGSPDKVRFQLPGEMELVEEADHLLDGLGPRFTDWWGYDPLPIDADLLPAIVPGFRRPFRLLPYGIKDKLTNDEMTILRRLSRPLPCHFALGRNRNLQGLAASIVKLWEKCEIAKIAVKRGVQNTNSEMMAEELKRLTGGTLLSRDREFIVFYRGKDFLPPAVSTAIKERGKHGIHRQKMDDSLSIDPVSEPSVEPTEPASVDELEETNDKKKRNIVSEEIKVRSTKSAIKRISTKLSVTLEKKVKAEKLLAELEKAAEPIKSEVDREGITKEERYMLRKVGLRMKPFLLLGRRGVFDGTVENMHLHWKYRELVKIISKDRCIEDVHGAARTLEAESGGILVAVERVNKGYAIIVYRGKNYQRPADLRPQTLLNKREAMKRSLEAQRRESLKLHVLNLTRNIDQLELQLVKDNLDTNFVQSTESKISDNKFESSDSNTNFESSEFCGSLESAHDQENVEATKGHGADSSTMHSNDCMNASSDSEETTEQVEPKDSFSQYEIRATEYELASSSESVLKETHSNTILDGSVDRGDSDPISHSENSHLSQGGMTCSANDNDTTHASDNERKELSVETARNKLRSSIHRGVEKGDNRVFSRAVPLSNRDRLVLRKQALKMKKRPVLAVGRNNVITGVAKAIRTHFQKNPLAIVNIKGRAKGTSIQEVVFKLEQATGAVLVSQEPNKVILYRGWGEGEEPGGAMKGKRSSSITSPGKEDRATLVAPPQLIAAIRLECGLQSSQEGEVTL